MATIEKTRYAVERIEDIPQGDVHDGRVRHKIREHLDIGGFGVNAYRAVSTDGHVIGEHAEDGIFSRGQEELYVVISGAATFTVDGDEIEAAPGTVVLVRSGVTRSAVAHEEGTTVLVVGGTPGKAYKPSPAELTAPMFDAYNAGDFERAARIVADIAAEHPTEAITWFNLSCCEARLGRTEDALDHLAKSLELDPRFVEVAREDEDLESIRSDPRFEKLVA
jgi:quercetin dioxygenase-like cupin family protein